MHFLYVHRFNFFYDFLLATGVVNKPTRSGLSLTPFSNSLKVQAVRGG